MKLGVRSKLLLMALVPITVSVVAADAYLSTVLNADLTEGVRADLMVRLNLVEGTASSFGAPLEDRTSWDGLADDLARRGEGRITIVRRDGVVLGDSDLDLAGLERVENHANRPEIVQAFSEKRGSATRRSSTVGQRMMYVASSFRKNGTVAGAVRLAKPLTEVGSALGRRPSHPNALG